MLVPSVLFAHIARPVPRPAALDAHDPPRHTPTLVRSGCDGSTGPCAERVLRVSARAVDRPRDVITAFVLLYHLFPYSVELGGTELRRLGQLERLRIDSTGGRDLDHTDSRGLVFQLVSALRVEGRKLVDHDHLAVAAGRNAGVLVRFDDRCAILELDVRRTTLEVSRGADLRLCQHRLARTRPWRFPRSMWSAPQRACRHPIPLGIRPASTPYRRCATPPWR